MAVGSRGCLSTVVAASGGVSAICATLVIAAPSCGVMSSSDCAEKAVCPDAAVEPVPDAGADIGSDSLDSDGPPSEGGSGGDVERLDSTAVDVMDAGVGNGGDGTDTGDVNDGAGDASCMRVDLPPSVNVDVTPWGASFKTSPTWNCTAAGTTTIDSAAGTITSTSCALGTLDFTNNVTQSVAGGPTVMVVRLRGLIVTNHHVVHLQGDKPIVFLVAGDVLVDSSGNIDAGATGTTPGPGGSIAVNCAGSTGAANANSQQGGGGGGFGTVGGFGSNLSGAKGAPGGAASSNANLQPLRGGCAGGAGGNGAGAPGAGGGAFEIAASGTITIGTATNVAILSAGGGGSPAVTMGQNVGSGGAGSGGGILLVAPAPATFGGGSAARVHGGGSGAAQGCACNPTSSTDNGQDGHSADNNAASGGPSMDINAAAGASGGVCAGSGCAVASAAPADGTAAQIALSASGGGGGGGRVQVTTGAATVVCE
jgi:hypothetical protein